MMKKDIYTAFDEILISFSNGEDLESCLLRYPEYQAELQPMVEAFLFARSTAAKTPDENSKIRAKNRVMAAAALLEPKKQVKTVWQHGFDFVNIRAQRAALTLFVVVSVLFTSGTGLVQASNGALPGDNLYSVKRGWEGLRLFFVLDENTKMTLSKAFDEERVEEIKELYSENRYEHVSFSGYVEKIDGELWTVSGIVVKVEAEKLNGQNIIVGSPVQIIGETDDGIIEAEQIILITAMQAGDPGVTPTMFNIPSDGESQESGEDEIESDSSSSAEGIESTEDHSSDGISSEQEHPSDSTESQGNELEGDKTVEPDEPTEQPEATESPEKPEDHPEETPDGSSGSPLVASN